MALRFSPPPFDERRQAPDLSASFEAFMNAYARSKQLGMAEQQAQNQQTTFNQQQADRGIQNQMTWGTPNPTPEYVADVGRAAQPDFQGPILPSMQTALENIKRIKEMRDLESRGAKAKIGSEEASAFKDTALGLKAMGESGNERKAASGEHEAKIRAELNTLSKPFNEVRDAYGRIKASANNPTAAGDLALIFNYMKVLDPGSTVREGEFATAQNSAGVPDRIISQYNKVLRGERLAPDQRNDFVSRAGELYSSQLQIQKKMEKQYSDLAKRVGVSPENVVLDRSLDNVTDSQALKPGVVQDGYRFKGGDPANPKSWTKL